MASRAARGRMAASYAVRDLLAVSLGPLPYLFGLHVAGNVRHAPVEMTVGLGASQCASCFGWRDDPRHVSAATAPDRPPAGPGGPTHPTGPAGPRPPSPQRPTR